MLNNTKENIQYFYPALHLHLSCTLDAAFASLQRGEGKEDRGGRAHGDFGVVAAGKEVGGKLGREQRSRQERMPGNRKWELGEEKKQGGLTRWEHSTRAWCSTGTPNLPLKAWVRSISRVMVG